MLQSKIISFFLCLLLLVQLLAVPQTVNTLDQSQETEELPFSDDSATGGCDFDYFNYHFIPPHHFTEMPKVYVFNIDLVYIHLSDEIPHNHSAEIESPPPDFIC